MNRDYDKDIFEPDDDDMDIGDIDDSAEGEDELFDGINVTMDDDIMAQLDMASSLPEVAPGRISIDTFLKNLDAYVFGTAGLIINPVALSVKEFACKRMTEIGEYFVEPVFSVDKADPTTLSIEYEMEYISAGQARNRLDYFVQL